MATLIEEVQKAKFEQLEAEILQCKNDVKEIWQQHLNIAEKAGLLLQELNRLEMEVFKCQKELG